jgi:hypothetical protein
LPIGDGRCGDQAYLDDWPVRFNGVVVLQHRGGGLGPWSLGSHRLGRWQGQVLVNGDPLLFYHFSGMRPVTDWLYDAGLWRWRTPLTALVRRHIYTPYARELRAATRSIRSAGIPRPATDSVFRSERKRELLARMLRHRTFVVATGAG